MKFERVRLEHFKCYESVDLDLRDGVTVIHGLNGSGKSSLLEACFFALYGAKALEQNLEDIVTIGFDSCRVELWFRHAGEQYRIERELKERSGDVRTTTCVLEGSQGTTEGARDVRRRVAGLLRMDAEAFVNCAYVRQGEVNKLINASPGERQDMLDELLQLGKLEEYRERASQARVGVGRVRDDKRGALNEVRDQIASKREAGLHERLNEKQSDRNEVESDIERHESNREEARETLESAREILEDFSETQERIRELEEEVEALREKITEGETEREALGESIDSLREKRDAAAEKRTEIVAGLDSFSADPDDIARQTVESQLTAHRETIDEYTEEIRELSVEKQEYDSEIESLETRVRELEERAEECRTEATELTTDVESTEATLEEKRTELATMKTESEQLRDSFSEEPVDCGEAADLLQRIRNELVTVRETIAEREAALENARERVSEAEELQSKGNCPECGQPIEGSPHVDALAERREAVERIESEIEELQDKKDDLSDRLETAQELVEREERVFEIESDVETLEQLLSEREATIAEKRERIESLREEARSVTETREAHLEAISELEEQVEECREQIAACNKEKSAIRERIDKLEALNSVLADIQSCESELETLRERRQERAELNDERRERLAEKRDRLRDLRESYDEDRAVTAREDKKRATEYLEEVEEVLDFLHERRDSLQGTIGAIRTEIEELESLENRAENLKASLERLESLYEETAQLEEMYGRLRGELRQRNVSTLERMLNETFDLVYENDTYSRIELDGEYELTVFQKDGEALDPNQLSGGERALFNLSLRCAIYRLLGEGIEGAAPMPPLILDEPTVFLDAGHVSQLVELVGAMEDLGVEQILVVSHDDELVAAADDLVTVRKDATTNRSRVERTEPILDGAFTAAAE